MLWAATVARGGELFAVNNNWNGPFVEIEGLTGNTSSKAGINLFLPLKQNQNSLFFLGADGAVFDSGINDIFNGNFGDVYTAGAYLGVRTHTSNDLIFGAWAGFDVQHTLLDNTFTRFIGGIEASNDNLVFRVNGFVPLTDAQSVSAADASKSSASAILTSINAGTSLKETSATGIEGEIGLRLPFDLLGNGGFLEEFRLTGGGYHYFDLVKDGGVTGGRIRGELDLYAFSDSGTRLTLTTTYEHDRRRDSRYSAGLRLAIPLGMASSSRTRSPGVQIKPAASHAQSGRSQMFRPIRRSTDIATNVSGTGTSGEAEFIVTNTDVEVIKAGAN